MNNAEIGHWYRLLSATDPVEVISLDDLDSVVEFQHFDGEIEALPIEDWQGLSPFEVDSPEYWTGPFEMDRQDINPDKLFYDYYVGESLSHRRPLVLMKRAEQLQRDEHTSVMSATHQGSKNDKRSLDKN